MIAAAAVATAATASQSIFHSVQSHMQFLRQLVRQRLSGGIQARSDLSIAKLKAGGAVRLQI
jgi:hypothetical protein